MKVERKALNTQRGKRRYFTMVNRAIGDMPIQKVDRKTIIERTGLADLYARQYPTAEGLQISLKQIFSFALSSGYFTGQNPADRLQLENILPSKSDVHNTKHRPALPYKDVGRFLEKLRNYRWRGQMQRFEGRPPVALWLELVILSGVRPGEARLATWKEFDERTMIWTVPWAHLKTGRFRKTDRPVPITRPMLAVLEEAKRIAFPEDSPRRDRGRVFQHGRHSPDQSPDALVFPSKVNKPYQEANLARFVRTVLKEPNVTPHGFRSTLRDWLRAETNFDDVLWQIQADHVLGDRTSQSYGHDPLLEQRRRMMEQWGEYCSRPTPEPQTGDVVVNISDRRKA